MIKINNLNKIYDKKKKNRNHVLKNINVTLPDKGLITFLGESGCGKTTLLNIIGGLDSFDGEIIYNEEKFNSYNSKKIDDYRLKNISYIFQNYLLLPNETVYENLRKALEIQGVIAEEEVEKRIEYALKSVGIYKYRKKLANYLSGGEQQRVSIARALVKNNSIIIADEPTGNLDRKNSIEVMNILKKISESRLVLLVTHSKELAEFYSDKIITLNDGVILGEREASLNSLDHSRDDIIYLKDLDKKEITTDKLVIDYYKDSDEVINLRLIKKGNKIYLESSNYELQVIDKTIEIKDESYQEITKEDMEKYDFDTTWYQDNEYEKVKFSKLFKNSLSNFFHSRKRTKVLNACYFMLGIIFAISMISISVGMSYNKNVPYLDDKYMIEPYYEFDMNMSLEKKLVEAYENGYISNFNSGSTNIYFNKNLSYNETSNLGFPIVSQMIFNENDDEIIFGERPKDNELLISEGLANQVLEKLSLNSYQDLLEYEIKTGYNYENHNICGVVRESGLAIYERVYGSNFSNDLNYNLINNKEITYEIIEGRDIVEDDEVVAVEGTGYKIGDIALSTFTVVGIASIDTPKYPRMLITTKSNDDIYRMYKYSSPYKYLPYDSEISIIEGRKIENNNECLVPEFCNQEIGTNFEGYKIVGKYRAHQKNYRASTILSYSEYDKIKNLGNMRYLWFDVHNLDKLRELLGTDFSVGLVKDINLATARENAYENLALFVMIGSGLVIISIIYVYFIMRSKVINDKYELAVYRNIGAKKKYIYRKYFSDLLVITLFTNLIGYLLIYGIFFGISLMIKSTNFSSIFNINPLPFFVGLILIFVTNLVIGIIPVRNKLKKTPAEISSEYDA